MTKFVSVFALCTLLSACAAAPVTVIDNHNGKLVHVPRPDLRLLGPSYDLRYDRAVPPGLSRPPQGDGGEVRGAVCGAQLALRVWLWQDHVTLRGSFAGAPASLALHNNEDSGQISGYLGDRDVELRYDGARLWGRVAGARVAMSLGARPEIGRLPAPARAAVLALLPGCDGAIPAG